MSSDNAQSDEASVERAWEKQILCRFTQTGEPRAQRNLANAITILRHHPQWRGAIALDEFTGLIVIVRPCPALTDRARSASVRVPWSDVHDVRAAEWLQRSPWNLELGVAVVSQAVHAVAHEQSFHPVRDYLSALDWDGVPRLDTWLMAYFGVEDTAYSRAVGRKWLISAIARVLEPGCKVDCVLILEGSQGVGKSTALRVLAGSWFADELADLGSKDAAMQLRGAWIIELSELDALGRAEVSKVKAFLSKASDRFRAPYGRHIADQPRQCVFAGTVNHNDYLTDETGNRRFWPVSCGAIKLGALEGDRDQLWAEAHQRYCDGEDWWLKDQDVLRAAGAEQEGRYRNDAWDERIAPWLTAQSSAITIGQVLERALNLDPSLWGQREQTRVARILKRRGWVRHQVRDGKRREWRYSRANADPSEVLGLQSPSAG